MHIIARLSSRVWPVAFLSPVVHEVALRNVLLTKESVLNAIEAAGFCCYMAPLKIITYLHYDFRGVVYSKICLVYYLPVYVFVFVFFLLFLIRFVIINRKCEKIGHFWKNMPFTVFNSPTIFFTSVFSNSYFE